ncbi:MAG: glucose-1-phosphate cytidylyltransferase [Myxococcota bacterium]|jgi:glucose-1-phosphate cytidylyltransferase
MNIFARQGHTRFILCVGYQGHKITEHFEDPANCGEGWEVITSDAGLSASKSERVAAAMTLVKSDRFFLSYGDDLANVDVAAVDAMARSGETVVTITAVQPMSPFGVLDLHEDGRITGFREKCQMNEWINGGFMSVSHAIGNYLHLGELEKEVFEALVAENRLTAYRHHGFWKAMNTHKQFLEFNELTGKGELPWQEME